MSDERMRFIGIVNGTLTATTGTIACGNAKKVNLQVILDTNPSREIAVKPVKSATGTASKASCAAVLTDLGIYTAYRPGAGSGNWWLARQNYAGSTASAGGAADRYALEKLG